MERIDENEEIHVKANEATCQYVYVFSVLPTQHTFHTYGFYLGKREKKLYKLYLERKEERFRIRNAQPIFTEKIKWSQCFWKKCIRIRDKVYDATRDKKAEIGSTAATAAQHRHR